MRLHDLVELSDSRFGEPCKLLRSVRFAESLNSNGVDWVSARLNGVNQNSVLLK